MREAGRTGVNTKSIEIENEAFICTQTDDIAFVSFKQNPIEILSDSEVMNSFFDTFAKIDDSRDIIGVVISNWSEYTGGIYLKEVISRIVENVIHERQNAAIQRLKNSIEQLINFFNNISKPTVAAMNGDIGEVLFTVGLGCDFRYITPSTTIYLPTLEFGFPTTGVLPYHLIHYIGLTRTREILLSRTSLSAAEVHELGLVTNIVTEEEIINHCIKKLNEISVFPIHGIAARKRILRPDANEISKYINRAFEEFILNLNEIKETLAGRS